MNNSSGKFPDVVGYITEAERIAIQCSLLATVSVEGDALEVGSLNGLSALLTLSVLRSDKTMICIEKGQVKTLSENLAKHGFKDQAAIYNDSFEVAELRPGVKLSWIFIDHDHEYKSTIAAFDKFFPFLSKNGLIAFHDFGHPDFIGGTQAIQELERAFSEDKQMIRMGSAGSLVVFKKL